jgi:hypothetical protein
MMHGFSKLHIQYFAVYNLSKFCAVACIFIFGVKMSIVKLSESIDPRKIRHDLGMNQQQFWSPLGITQSGGSRYESGRNIPKAVLELLKLLYVERIDIKSIKRGDWEVVQYLKSEDLALFKLLKKSAQSHVKNAV